MFSEELWRIIPIRESLVDKIFKELIKSHSVFCEVNCDDVRASGYIFVSHSLGFNTVFQIMSFEETNMVRAHLEALPCEKKQYFVSTT